MVKCVLPIRLHFGDVCSIVYSDHEIRHRPTLKCSTGVTRKTVLIRPVRVANCRKLSNLYDSSSSLRVMSTPPQVKKALLGLLRDPANNTCADCKAASHPRWASWSLGVFICIRCAGLHRSLGTHISKVKSVDLDAWKEDELVQLKKMSNNSIANDYYEAKLPETMRRPITDANQLQNFVRNKYEKKKWVGTGVQSEPSGHTPNAERKPEESSTESLLTDLEEPSVERTSTSSMLNLQLSSVPKPRPEQQNGRDFSRPDLKKSILSLYSKPRNGESKNSFYQSSNSTGSSLQNNNNNSKESGSNNVSVNSLDDNELFKNVWTT